MTKGRLEAFSDGVIAILITIMVLELRIPHGDDWTALRPLVSVLLTYILSFVLLGIYWTNHHHLIAATSRINGKILWANLHLLFWLSLVPVVTAWMGNHPQATVPCAIYGLDMVMAALAWNVLQTEIIAHEGNDSCLAVAVGNDLKGKLSLILYTAAVPLAFVHPWISDMLFVGVALMWLVPDRRIESRIHK